jgi:hypothetical protein
MVTPVWLDAAAVAHAIAHAASIAVSFGLSSGKNFGALSSMRNLLDKRSAAQRLDGRAI